MRELWAKTHENRPKSKKTQSEPETCRPDKMSESEEIDSLVTKISEGVFAKLSSSLDIKLNQIDRARCAKM